MTEILILNPGVFLIPWWGAGSEWSVHFRDNQVGHSEQT